MSALKVFIARFPASCTPTLCLLRRRVRLSRELRDDVVRMRGRVQTSHDYTFLVQTSVFDDKRHGLKRWWDDYGTLLAYIPFVDDKPRGIAQWWHENGTLELEIKFVDGKQHGLERMWHENGTLRQVVMHESGNVVSRTTNSVGM